LLTISRAGTYAFSFWEAVAGPGTFTLQASVGSKSTFNGLVSNAFPGWVQQSANVLLSAGTNAVQFSGAYSSGAVTSGLLIDDVSLTFLSLATLTPLLPSAAPVNAVNVAGGIDNFLNNGGTLPQNLSNLTNLTGQQLASTLLQLDGEAATDAEKGAFQLMNQFLGLMLDPFVDGRFGFGPNNFAPDQQNFPPDIALAYASVMKAPRYRAPENRWGIWGTGFGGSTRSSGDAAIGSNDVTARTFGFAAGADYRANRDTTLGFALAGAGTNWGLAQGFGGGRSDAFQVGGYGKTMLGPIYVAGAAAFTSNWFNTNRFALGDQITAKFNGQSFGGRLESGYRYVVPTSAGQFEISPYAALQAQWFHTPTYSETDLSGGGLGLTYNTMSATDTRSELGARFADHTAVGGMPLILRTRLAWAHDWVSNPALNAVFQVLPGASFVVNGAPIPSDSALASVGAELHMTTHWSLSGKFDSEFARNSQTYAGTGTLRYTW
jgi:hypothetical protein